MLLKRNINKNIVDKNLEISKDKNIALENFTKKNGEYVFWYKGIKTNKTYSNNFISFINNNYYNLNKVEYGQFLPYFQSLINTDEYETLLSNNFEETKGKIVKIENRIILNNYKKDRERDIAIWLNMSQLEWDNFELAVKLIDEYHKNKIEKSYYNAKRYNENVNYNKYKKFYYSENKTLDTKSKFLGHIIRSYDNNFKNKIGRKLGIDDLNNIVTSHLMPKEFLVRKKIYIKESEFNILKNLGIGLDNVKISRILIALFSYYYTICDGKRIECLICKNIFDTEEELLDLRNWYPIYYDDIE